MLKTTTWTPNTGAVLRNGAIACTGIELIATFRPVGDISTFLVQALTSKGQIASGFIEIPVSAIPELIAHLNSIKLTEDMKSIKLPRKGDN